MGLAVDTDEVKRLVAFAVYMQHDTGIMGKSPAYVAEKFFRTQHGEVGLLHQGMDLENMNRYKAWLESWMPDPNTYGYCPIHLNVFIGMDGWVCPQCERMEVNE